MDQSDYSSPTIQAVQERLYVMEGIVNVTKQMLSESDIDRLLDNLVTVIPDSFLCDTVFVYILDDEQEYAVLRAGFPQASSLRGYRVRVDSSTLVGWSILNNQAKITTSDGVRLFPIPHSSMVLPLATNENRMIGAVELFATQDSLKAEYLPLFEIMAGFIASVIEMLE